MLFVRPYGDMTAEGKGLWQVISVGKNYNVNAVIFAPTLTQANELGAVIDEKVRTTVDRIDTLAATTRRKGLEQFELFA